MTCPDPSTLLLKAPTFPAVRSATGGWFPAEVLYKHCPLLGLRALLWEQWPVSAMVQRPVPFALICDILKGCPSSRAPFGICWGLCYSSITFHLSRLILWPSASHRCCWEYSPVNLLCSSLHNRVASQKTRHKIVAKVGKSPRILSPGPAFYPHPQLMASRICCQISGAKGQIDCPSIVQLFFFSRSFSN